MKIALFHNLPWGGAKRALYEHGWRLRERGHTVDGYTLSTAAEDFLPLDDFCDRVFRYDLNVPDGRRARLLQALLDRPWLWRCLSPHQRALVEDYQLVHRHHLQIDRLERLYRHVAEEIDGRGYDVVYVHHCQFLLAPALLRRLETPSIYYAQDTLRSACEWTLVGHPEYDSWADTFYMRHLLGRTFTLAQVSLMHRKVQEAARNTRAASLVLCNSWYSREALVRSTGTNSRVCYLGVDSHFFRPDPSIAREPVVLSVGTLFPHKGHRTVIEALATMEPARRPRMRIIGYELKPGEKQLGPMAMDLLALAERSGVALSIDKEVSDETLRDAYREAAVVAFTPHLEPFGLVTLEAMACGTPVVGVCEGGLRETIQDETTGLLAGRDPEEIGAAIDRLLSDPAEAERMGANGREAVEQMWSWERSVDELEGSIERVLGRDPARTERAVPERPSAGAGAALPSDPVASHSRDVRRASNA